MIDGNFWKRVRECSVFPKSRINENGDKEKKQELEKAIRIKANFKLLQQQIEHSTGKKVTLKHIADMKQKKKQENVLKKRLRQRYWLPSAIAGIHC